MNSMTRRHWLAAVAALPLAAGAARAAVPVVEIVARRQGCSVDSRCPGSAEGAAVTMIARADPS